MIEGLEELFPFTQLTTIRKTSVLLESEYLKGVLYLRIKTSDGKKVPHDICFKAGLERISLNDFKKALLRADMADRLDQKVDRCGAS